MAGLIKVCKIEDRWTICVNMYTLFSCRWSYQYDHCHDDHSGLRPAGSRGERDLWGLGVPGPQPYTPHLRQCLRLSPLGGDGRPSSRAVTQDVDADSDRTDQLLLQCQKWAEHKLLCINGSLRFRWGNDTIVVKLSDNSFQALLLRLTTYSILLWPLNLRTLNVILIKATLI